MTAKILKADELLHKNEAFKKISEIISRAFAFVGRPCHHDEATCWT
ncbi:hypothetical protein LPL9_2995 [Lacticaseibacillus paracasei]|uniref:Uncharacterized protein n=1 Tax=Lacticaseibacillus paracasei subsp. paracasei TaxID=47714 RepID=A0AAP9HK44_LACPA|nr:Hypothetical protein LOCK919_3124 [Lacticaseibacillus paracasei]AKU61049.1 hypothetical protein LPL9_2995 [Lacticaseibacillus paracasei]EPC23358.1 hypothetical protein Lpp17_2334 [Lacticaseibacillus paracasei subsp. paracasei Lpp17]EPC26403.1 hypothetical protein Lpp46_1709 [Lacticaseibacillus paracasei subsp. paracasei Lpp46]QGV19642.1 Hypothetical protein LCAKO_3155 [Lacticaseibacillus paracasei subsp. paracasei]